MISGHSVKIPVRAFSNMTEPQEEKLLALLRESERFPEILRDDAFWSHLEALQPEDRRTAVRDRFFSVLPEDEPPPLVEIWAALAACVAEVIDRLGPTAARAYLQPKKH